jgi:hypothetical protein
VGGVFNLRVGGAYVGILYWKIDNIQSIRNNLINNIFFLFENIARRHNTVQVSSELKRKKNKIYPSNNLLFVCSYENWNIAKG